MHVGSPEVTWAEHSAPPLNMQSIGIFQYAVLGECEASPRHDDAGTQQEHSISPVAGTQHAHSTLPGVEHAYWVAGGNWAEHPAAPPLNMQSIGISPS